MANSSAARLIDALLTRIAQLKEKNRALKASRWCGLTVTPVNAYFGAEVYGADLSQHINKELLESIQKLFAKHQLLVFRSQSHLTPEDQARFARLFDPNSKTVWRDQRTNPWERFKAEKMGGAGTY